MNPEPLPTGPNVHLGDACHAMLARLAGRVPDGLLTQARHWLAEHDVLSVARTVAAHAAAARLPIASADAEFVRALLAGAGLPTARTEAIEVTDGEPPVDHVFAPAEPEVAEANRGRIGYCLDLTTPPGPGRPDGLTDEFDTAAARAASAVPGALALWRTWRSPAAGAPWPRPRRVHLLALHATSHTRPYMAAGLLQQDLARLGEQDPQVEAFGVDAVLPVYQRTARAHAALLWSARPGPPVRLARVYDAVNDGSGPAFSPDRPRLDDLERGRIVQLMAAGTMLLATTAQLPDVLDPDRAPCVSANFRTDGAWVWNDAAEYYARTYGMAPVRDLLDHLRSLGTARPPVPDAVGLFRAMAALTEPVRGSGQTAQAAPGTCPRPVRRQGRGECD